VSAQTTITSLEDQPFEITEVSTTIPDKIKYKLKTIKKGKEYSLEIKNRSTKEKSFIGDIILKTTSKNKPHIVVPVSCSLKQEVAMIPQTVSFGTVDSAKGNVAADKLKKKVVLKDVRGKGITIKKVKTSRDWITTEVSNKKGDKNGTVSIILDKEKLPKGKFNEKVEIRTNYKKSLVVDIIGEVL